MLNKHKVQLMLNLIFIFFMSAVCFSYISSMYLGMSYPYNTFLFLNTVKFTDMFDVIHMAASNNPYLSHFYKSIYLPFANLLLYACSHFDKTELVLVYSIVLFIFFFVFAYMQLKDISLDAIKDSLIFSFCSYPVLFTIDRGNIEGVLFIFVALFFFFLSKRQNILAGIFIAFSISLKLYPIVYLIFLVKAAKYKAILVAVCVSFLLTAIPFAIFQGSFVDNIISFLFKNGISESKMVKAFPFSLPSLSAYASIKILFIKLGLLSNIDFLLFNNIYTTACIFIAITVPLLIIAFNFEEWESAFILTSLIIVLPPISANYKLIYFYIPLFMFLRSNKTFRGSLIICFIFAFLVSPFQYFFYNGVETDIQNCRDTFSIDLTIKTVLATFTSIFLIGYRIIYGCRSFHGAKCQQ